VAEDKKKADAAAKRAAAEKKKEEEKNRPADAQWTDFAQVSFAGKVVRATYGPLANPATFTDYTTKVQELIGAGKTTINGGIHTAIGDPYPGIAKVFKVWYVKK